MEMAEQRPFYQSKVPLGSLRIRYWHIFETAPPRNVMPITNGRFSGEAAAALLDEHSPEPVQTERSRQAVNRKRYNDLTKGLALPRRTRAMHMENNIQQGPAFAAACVDDPTAPGANALSHLIKTNTAAILLSGDARFAHAPMSAAVEKFHNGKQNADRRGPPGRDPGRRRAWQSG